jgi:hypothetical protein
VTLVLFHWSWAEGGPHTLVHGWSQQAEADAAGYVHLDAEDGEPPATRQVDPDGYPAARRHTFRSVAELPGELTDAGQPLPWVQALVAARAARRA